MQQQIAMHLELGTQTDMSGQNSAGDNAAVIAPVTNASATDTSVNGSDKCKWTNGQYLV